jgi:hypothetical protein
VKSIIYQLIGRNLLIQCSMHMTEAVVSFETLVTTSCNFGIEVLTPVVMKNSMVLDINTFSPLKLNQHFVGKCRLHLQVGSACHMLSRWLLDRLIFRPRRWKRYVLAKRYSTLNELHGVVTQKMVFVLLPTRLHGVTYNNLRYCN